MKANDKIGDINSKDKEAKAGVIDSKDTRNSIEQVLKDQNFEYISETLRIKVETIFRNQENDGKFVYHLKTKIQRDSRDWVSGYSLKEVFYKIFERVYDLSDIDDNETDLYTICKAIDNAVKENKKDIPNSFKECRIIGNDKQDY